MSLIDSQFSPILSLNPSNLPNSLYEYSSIYTNSKTIPFSIKSPSEYFYNLSQTEYNKFLFYLCNIISKIGIILHLKNKIILTSKKLLNYFYYKIPCLIYNPLSVLTTCIFLANKLDDKYIEINSIINGILYFFVYERNDNKIYKYNEISINSEMSDKNNESDTNNESDNNLNNKNRYDIYKNRKKDFYNKKIFNKIKENENIIELILIKELNYDLNFFSFHPHIFIEEMLKILNINLDKKLFQKIFDVLNTIYNSSIICNYNNNILCVSAIFITIFYYDDYYKKDLFNNNIENFWEIFNVDLKDIENIFVEFYKINNVYCNVGYQEIKGIINNMKKEKIFEIKYVDEINVNNIKILNNINNNNSNMNINTIKSNNSKNNNKNNLIIYKENKDNNFKLSDNNNNNQNKKLLSIIKNHYHNSKNKHDNNSDYYNKDYSSNYSYKKTYNHHHKHHSHSHSAHHNSNKKHHHHHIHSRSRENTSYDKNYYKNNKKHKYNK